MRKYKYNYSLFVAWALLLAGPSSEAQDCPVQDSDSIRQLVNKLIPQGVPDAAAQSHIRQIIESFPADSSLRQNLEAGHFGTGIHEPWMDNMKRASVKVRGVWHSSTRFQPQAIKRIIYRKYYDGPSSQITNPGELARFEESGLQNKLQEAAFRQSRNAIWIGIDSPPKNGDACIVDIQLFDDKWLLEDATNVPTMRCGRIQAHDRGYNPEEFPLAYAAAAGDLATVQNQLSTQQFSREQLNGALFLAVIHRSDNTDVISLLLGAGADINASRSPNGTTLLMDSVATLNLANIRLLVSSGADVSRKTTDGWTAYCLAMQQMKQFRDHCEQSPDYISELLNLLRPSDGAF